MDLMPVYDSTSLSKTKEYQINGYCALWAVRGTSRASSVRSQKSEVRSQNCGINK